MNAAGTDRNSATSTAISEPHGLANMCGTKPSTDTIAAAAGPYAKPAIRQTMPDGSYFSQVTGVIGNSMKLVTIASATNSAYMAIRRVDQRPESATPVVCEPSLALVLAVDVLAEPSASGCHRTNNLHANTRRYTHNEPSFLPSGLYRWLRNLTGSAACAGRGLPAIPVMETRGAGYRQ